jgi:hypothetical protein
VPSLRSARTFLLFAASLCVAITGHRSFADSLTPIVFSSLSQNGRFLVIAEYTNVPAGNGSERTVSTTYRIVESDSYIGNIYSMKLPGKLWYGSGFGWHVTLPAQNDFLGYAWPIVTNDGKYLVLISMSQPMMPGNGQYLRIYRRKDDHIGEVVRSFKITDLWTPQRVASDASVAAMDGYPPRWVTGGTFRFSDDSQKLTYRNQWQEEIEINLSDGAITRKR